MIKTIDVCLPYVLCAKEVGHYPMDRSLGQSDRMSRNGLGREFWSLYKVSHCHFLNVTILFCVRGVRYPKRNYRLALKCLGE